jgi:hypothetical protein
MSTWPDPTVFVPTDNVDDDTDSATLSREDINTAFNILNQIIGTMGNDAVPTTNQNDGPYMKAVAGTNTNEIMILDVNGHPITSNKTIATSLVNTTSQVPTSSAVVAALAGAGGTDDIFATDSNTNGYIIFNTGFTTKILFHWGHNLTNGNNVVTGFSPNFAATPYCVMATSTKGATSEVSAVISAYSASSFTTKAGTGVTGLFWMAIGPYTS